MATKQAGRGTRPPAETRDQRPIAPADGLAAVDREERHQLTRERVPAEPVRPTGASQRPNQDLPGDRAGDPQEGNRGERTPDRASPPSNEAEQPSGQARSHPDRAAEDLDREDAALHREGVAGEKPGVRGG